MDPLLWDWADLPEAARGALRAQPPAGDEALDRLRDVMDRVPAAAALLESWGIEADIVRDTLSDIGLVAGVCLRETGRPGLTARGYQWVRLHLSGRLFRVGRMQCQPGVLGADWNVRVLQQTGTGRVLALADGPCRFRADGQLDGTNGIAAGADGFDGGLRLEAAADGQRLVGTALSPRGHALRKTASIPLCSWREVLREGMPVFHLHIPKGPDFTVQSCRASLEGMAAFALRHARAIRALCGVEAPFAAFTLGSWLLDAQLEHLLPPDAGLVRNLQAYYLIPVLSDEQPTLERVFGVPRLDPALAGETQRRTSLQRAILAHMAGGGRMRYNFGFVLWQDARRFGQGHYRADFDALMEELCPESMK